MPHLSQAQEETRNRIKILAGRGLLPDDLGREIVSALQRAIPSDEMVLLGIDPESLLINRILGMLGNNPKGTFYWLRNVYLVNEPMEELTIPGMMARNLRAVILRDRPEHCWGVPAAIFSGVTTHQFYNSYHDIGTPPGGGLRGWFDAEGRKIAAIQMVRADSTHHYRPSDAHFLQLLAPLIARSLSAAFAREEAQLSVGEDQMAAGMIAINSSGQVIMQSRTADRWFEVLTDSRYGQPESTGPSALPVFVWSALAGLRANVGQGAFHVRLRVPTHLGMLRVEASPSDADGAIAVVLVPERPQPQLELPHSWQLTPQERRVLTLVARGLTNRQISEALVVTEHTVETHLGHAYEKLSVNSRTQFLSRLFRDAYWPLEMPE